jgi:hypothetical protein
VRAPSTARRIRLILPALVSCACLCLPGAAWAQARLKVAVILPEVQDVGKPLAGCARRVADSVSLGLRLGGRSSVDAIGFLTPSFDPARALRYLTDRSYDGAVWGLVSAGDAGFTVELAAWRKGEERPVIRERREAATMDALPAAADAAVKAVLARFTGAPVGLGVIRLHPGGEPLSYRVRLNGEPAGEGVVELPVPAMTVKVQVSAVINQREYLQHEQTVAVADGSVTDISFALSAPGSTDAGQPEAAARPAGFGSLSIVVDPPGSTVAVDGAAAGTAPLTLADLAAGSHTVGITMPGYLPQEKVAAVVPDARADYHYDMMLNPDSPEVRRLLLNPGAIALASGLLSLGELGFLFANVYSPVSEIRSFDIGFSLFPRIGLFMADEPGWAALENAVSAACAFGYAYLGFNVPLAIGSILTMFVDPIAALIIAENKNRALVDRISRSGLPAAEPGPARFLPWDVELAVSVEPDGVMTTVGAGYALFDGVLGLGARAGVTWTQEAPKIAAAARLAWNPLAASFLRLHPYLAAGASWQADADTNVVAPTVTIGLRGELGRFFWSAESAAAIVDPPYTSPGVAAGWRF